MSLKDDLLQASKQYQLGQYLQGVLTQQAQQGLYPLVLSHAFIRETLAHYRVPLSEITLFLKREDFRYKFTDDKIPIDTTTITIFAQPGTKNTSFSSKIAEILRNVFVPDPCQQQIKDFLFKEVTQGRLPVLPQHFLVALKTQYPSLTFEKIQRWLKNEDLDSREEKKDEQVCLVVCLPKNHK